jgi:hypothetical protein
MKKRTGMNGKKMIEEGREEIYTVASRELRL